MGSRETPKCLEPVVNNIWNRRKDYFENCAILSSIHKFNSNLPEPLLEPLVTISDVSALKNKFYTFINWTRVRITVESDIRTRPLPVYPPKILKKNQPTTQSRTTVVTKVAESSESVEDIANDKEKKKVFTNEIVEIVHNIRKYAQPTFYGAPTWITDEKAQKTGKYISLILTSLPGILSIDDVVNALFVEYGVGILENLILEIPELSLGFIESIMKNAATSNRNRIRCHLLTRIMELFPQFKRRIAEKLGNSRMDAVFGVHLAVDYLPDTQFLEYLEPILTNTDAELVKHIIRSPSRQIIDAIIDKLIRLAKKVLFCTPEDIPDVAYAPYTTKISYCLIEMYTYMDGKWQNDNIILMTKFVFRTHICELAPRTPEMEMEPVEEPMEDYGVSYIPLDDDDIVMDSDSQKDSHKGSSRSSRRRPIFNPPMDPSPFGDAHESFVLAALISIPIFSQYPANQTAAVQPPDRAVEVWLETQRKRIINVKFIDTSFYMNLIYVHSCLMSGRCDDLSSFAGEMMRRRIELSSRNLHSTVLKNAFLSRCLSEIEIANLCTKQSVAKNLNQLTDGRHAIHSIFSLQAAGVFRTYMIYNGLKVWIQNQIDNVALPASELLAEVIEIFALNTVVVKTPGINTDYILECFNGDMVDNKRLTKRLFVFYYLCCYKEQTLRQDVRMRDLLYPQELYENLPIRVLLSAMEINHQDYEHIRSKIISKCVTIFPYLLPTPRSISIVAKLQKIVKTGHEAKITRMNMQRLAKLMKTVDTENRALFHVLETIYRMPFNDQILAIPTVLDCFMISLDSDRYQGYEQMMITLFEKFEQMVPKMLFEYAAKKWLEHDEDVEVSDIFKIPSLLFRCDPRILNSPCHFYCFVRALNFFAIYTRSELRLKVQIMNQRFQAHSLKTINPLSEAERKDKEHLTSAYIDSQHSVLIHALIEICDSKRMNDDPSDSGMMEKRKQILQIACQYMHRAFIDYDQLMKVTLYQKFPLRQIRDLVENVPSLFAAHSSILEMLSLADQQRRFFGIVLAAEISRKYRVRESLETARTVCDIVHSLHKYGELPSSNKLWKHVAPALMILMTEFPSLTDSVTRLLYRVVANAKSRLIVRCGMLAGDPKHEEYQLINTINTFLDRDKKPVDTVISDTSI